ncbi:MAG: hypothetical protein FJ301_14390 [Planctomycetes bacterium]|nr:hypothetical protein [Planctomycetota bacterium]
MLSLTGYALGIPLDLLGMPGCFQHAGLDYVDAYLVAQRTASTLFAVPAQPALAGLHVYAQAFSFAATANPFGVVLSNGMDLTIGAL